jgi:hypothetical protein
LDLQLELFLSGIDRMDLEGYGPTRQHTTMRCALFEWLLSVVLLDEIQKAAAGTAT